jgi:hypothetical protein
MNRLSRLAALAAIVASTVATVSWGQSISTVASNNSGGGVFIDLTANATPLIVTGFQTQISQATHPLATTIQVWTRAGTYVGNTGSAGWTLTQTVYATAAVTTVNSETVDLPVQIQVPAGATTGVYLHSTTSNSMRITGTSSIVPTTTFSNADITLFTNTTRTTTTAFGGTVTTNRAFSGTIFYVPDTGSGACCTTAGACAIDTSTNCLASSGLYRGPGTVCDPTPCPVGSCCDTTGACTIVLRTSCVLPAQYSAGATCASLCPTGACCKPDGSCVAGLYTSACLALSGFHNGDNSTCPGVPCFPDFEPNSTKAEAPLIVVTPGMVIRGHSTSNSLTAGSTSDATVDTFRLKMAAAPAGIYEYKATASTPVANVVGNILGFTQTAATAAPWTGTLGTATATETNVQVGVNTAPSTDRISTWYGFGKQEELYYRVNGGPTTSGNYSVAIDRSTITPTDIGTFATGTIDIFTTGVVVATTDTAIAVFDSNLNPIPGYTNFNQSVNSYTGSAAQAFTSYLRRSYAPGEYYLAMSIGDVTTNLGAPSDDNLRTTALLDFGGAALSTSGSSATNVSFNIKDGTDHVITAARTNKSEIRWFKFTVNPAVPTGACCSSSGTCTQISASDCLTIADAVYHGNDTTCAGAPCLLGACCLHDTTCSAQFPAQCASASGLHLGEGVACPAGACRIELEPNSTRLEATEVTLGSGEAIRGRSTGTVTVPLTGDLDSADYFRVRTTPAAPGLYHHVLTLSSPTPTANGISIRGIEQAPTLPGSWPGPVGTATSTEVTVQSYTPVGDNRVVQWYGFGKEEQVTCRVGGSGTLSLLPYAVTLATTPVVPTSLGAFYEGDILITTGSSGHFTDTVLRVFAADYTPIDGYANDDASIYGGSPGNSGTVSFLLRHYAPGTYYLAITASGLATDQGTPCDDNTRDGLMIEFPNAVVSADSSTATDLSFIVYDGTFHQFPASRGGRAEVAWFTFTVTPPPTTGVCCRGTTCNTTVAQNDCTAAAPVGALFVTTPTSTCNDAGVTRTPCCYADFNKNGSLQVQDIFDFLNSWFAGSPFAKVAGDGVSGPLAISDIFDFLNAWFAGC